MLREERIVKDLKKQLCPKHNEAPKIWMKGNSAKIECCCDEFGVVVKEKFEAAVHKEVEGIADDFLNRLK